MKKHSVDKDEKTRRESQNNSHPVYLADIVIFEPEMESRNLTAKCEGGRVLGSTIGILARDPDKSKEGKRRCL